MADYYPAADGGGAGDGDGGSDAGAAGAPAGKPEDAKPQGETALIPKGLLAGKEFQPGEEVVFKIVAMRGDEVEIEYATGEEEDKSAGGDKGESPEMAGAMEKMGSYAS